MATTTYSTESAAGNLTARALREGIINRIVRFAEHRYGEEINARITMVNTHKNEAGFDPFGFDPETARLMLAVLMFLHRTYFRTEVSGIENVPQGRALFIANHSGQIPVDGMLIAASLMLDVNPPVLPRSIGCSRGLACRPRRRHAGSDAPRVGLSSPPQRITGGRDDDRTHRLGRSTGR